MNEKQVKSLEDREKETLSYAMNELKGALIELWAVIKKDLWVLN